MRVSATTTIVLSILLLATRPCFTRRRLRSISGCSMTCLGDALFRDRGLDLRVVAARGFHLREIRKVAGAQREAQVEKFFFGFAGFLFELVDGQIAQRTQ